MLQMKFNNEGGKKNRSPNIYERNNFKSLRQEMFVENFQG